MANFLYYESDRVHSILGGTSDYFVYDVGSLTYSGNIVPLHRIHAIGQTAVNLYGNTIEKYSAKYGVDSDLVKAIVYIENSQGWKDKFVEPLSILGYRPSSALPMNIQPGTWGALLPGLDIYGDYDANIELGVKLISEIASRLPAGATLADIATLYNSLAKDANSLYGIQVYDDYTRKLWTFQGGNYGEPSSPLSPGIQPHRFPAGTEITIDDGEKRKIEDLFPQHEVLAFDPAGHYGRGGLLPKQVTHLFHNVTDSWIILSNGLTVTPGHHFLDAFGNFRTIADILNTDGQVVLADGAMPR